MKKKEIIQVSIEHLGEHAGTTLARLTKVHLPGGSYLLYDLLQDPGVSKRIRFMTRYEYPIGTDKLVEKCTGYGIVLKNGITLQGIEPQVFNSLGGGRS